MTGPLLRFNYVPLFGVPGDVLGGGHVGGEQPRVQTHRPRQRSSAACGLLLFVALRPVFIIAVLAHDVDDGVHDGHDGAHGRHEQRR